MKAGVFSDAEEEEDPVPLTFVGIKAEPEVSCVSMSMLWDFTNTGIPHFVNTQFMNFCYNEQLITTYICEQYCCESREIHTQQRASGEKQASPPA
jgi:hypothetical protein